MNSDSSQEYRSVASPARISSGTTKPGPSFGAAPPQARSVSNTGWDIAVLQEIAAWRNSRSSSGPNPSFP
ncbi:hypothetical protein GCM10027176_38300 [Actinoallomurus bryophytorum]